MADYLITDGRSEVYPRHHHGGCFSGATASFWEENDFSGPSASILAIPSLSLSPLTLSQILVDSKFFGFHTREYDSDSLIDITTCGTVRSHDLRDGRARWKFIETSDNVWDFSAIDAWVDLHYAAGRDIIFTLFGTPAWASARPTEEGVYGPFNLGLQAEPSDMAKWDRFCAKMAERYLGKIKYYEIWNEPNLDNDGTGATGTDFFFSGTYAKLAEMTRRANQAIKAIDPTAKIICPATTGWTDSSGSSAENYFLNMMAASTGDGTTTMKDWVDIVGVHLYLSGNRVQAVPGMVDRINASKASVGLSSIETWDTEHCPLGPTAADLDDWKLEKLLARMMIASAAKGIARSCYYLYDSSTYGFNTKSTIINGREWVANLLMQGKIQSASMFTDGRVAIWTPLGLGII